MSSEGRGLFSRKHERLSPVGDESGVNMKLSYNADAGKLNLTLDEDLSSVVESPLAEYLFKEKRRCRTLQAAKTTSDRMRKRITTSRPVSGSRPTRSVKRSPTSG